MLPEVIDESQVHLFKFWFGDRVQDGINYRGELYYRLHSVEVGARAQLYHAACRLSQQQADVVMTLTPTQCSLWVDLRNREAVMALLHNQSSLPGLTNP